MAEDLQVRGAKEFPEATLRRPVGVAGKKVLLACGMVVGGIAVLVPWAGKLVVLSLGIPLLGMAAWMTWKAPEGGTGLRVDFSGIAVNGQLQLSRSWINRATVVEEGQETTVVLQNRLFVCLVDVRDGEEGRALVRALGMDPTGAMIEFSFDSPLAKYVPPWLFWLYLFVPLLFNIPLVSRFPWLTLLLLALWYTGLLAMAFP
ncbi:MAG: hypothetical protein RMJ98_03985, partial [Myxococcales bacterium]|nr:hypothetical protein [Polyangiaceae bacterium]MDW8248449.1 hypothetical protein [Myxococcales bacterium]